MYLFKFKIVNPIPEPLILIKGGKLRFMSYLPEPNSITVGIGGDLFLRYLILCFSSSA